MAGQRHSKTVRATQGRQRTRVKAVAPDIEAMVNRIVNQFHPERIILFGSRARGDARPDSDVDFLVVMPVPDSKARQETLIGVALHDFAVAKDIVVSTPEEYAWRKDIIGTIEYPATEEGSVVYARS
jgi:predicted nucleotidyltransferase